MDEVITEISGPEYPPSSGKDPKQLVVLLHGLGSDGKDLISLAYEYSSVLPDAHFISPNAPFGCDMAPFGYQWFSLMEWTPESMLKGANEAAPILNHFIDKSLEKFKLKDENLAFIGFSQGTMMSMHVALRRPKACAGVLGYSGALLGEEEIEKKTKSKPNISLIHGMLDPVVPFIALDNAVRNLKKVGIEAENHARPMLAHGIDPEGIEIGKDFLKKIFKA